MSSSRWDIPAEILFEEVKQRLALGEQVKIPVTGMSMWPFICHGRDSVILEAAIPGKLRVGDIVLLRKPDGDYLLHRITAMTADSVRTTGDSQCNHDGWFPKEAVLAVVKIILRKGKSISCRNFFWGCIMGVWRICFPIRNKLIQFLLRLSRLKS